MTSERARSVLRIASTMLLLGAVVLVSGCNSMPRRDPEFSAMYPVAHQRAPQGATGSIYQRGQDLALFQDIKARRVGDILTIRLTEATDASKSSSTSLDRSSSNTITNPTLFGASPQFNLPGFLPLDNTRNNTLDANLSSNHAFEGDADSAQSNSLNGSITVTVADVLPNGNLFVRGEKRLNLNQGNEYVKISGIVRPVDIATDNSVFSTQVADATIVYNQDGAQADANKLGWLARFFVSALLPF